MNLLKRNLLKTSKNGLKQIEQAKRMGLIDKKVADNLIKALEGSMKKAENEEN